MQLDDGTNPIFIGAKEQNTRVCAWRVFPYIGKAFVGSDKKSVFLLNDFPERRVFPSTHLLVNYPDGVIALLT